MYQIYTRATANELTIRPQAYDELEESNAIVTVFVKASEQSGGGIVIWQMKILSELPQSHHATARRIHLLGYERANTRRPMYLLQATRSILEINENAIIAFPGGRV